jgi:hypothetical protein
MSGSTELCCLELHCHTAFSKDGLMEFQALVQTAAAVGLSALAITDHDTVEGARTFQQLARDQGLPLQIIVGEEKTLSDGSHLLGLFLQKEIESSDLPEALREIEGQGGICLIPHPFRRKDGLLRDGLERLRHFEHRIAGFELFSAKCSQAENCRARELLATSLSPFGGSDAHYECDLGESLNLVTWQGDWKMSLSLMLQRKAPFRILGKAQAEGAVERSYAPLYYRWRKFLRVPRPLVPLARQGYRWYRNKKHGVGRKPLIEIYAHP